MKSIGELRKAVEERFLTEKIDDIVHNVSGLIKLVFDHVECSDCLYCGMPTIDGGPYREYLQKMGLLETRHRPRNSLYYHLTPKAYEFYRKALNGATRVKISNKPHRAYSKA